MPRLPLLDEHSVGDVADRVRSRRGGRLTPLDRLLLHSPPVTDGWNGMLGAIRSRTTLAADMRELVICRVAAINDAGYEWAAHAPLVLASGVTAQELEAVRTGTPGVLSEGLQAAVDYASAMTEHVAVPDELFRRVRRHLDEREVVELTATVAAYNMVSRFLVALQLEPDEPPTVGEQ